jgi:phage internal scaffolding protein
MFIRSNYNYDQQEASEASAVTCAEPTLTQQHFKEQQDINRIVKQYAKTGVAVQTIRKPMPDDYVGITDYHSAMNAIRAGDDAFAELPSNIRERFNNDPAEFVDFCLDEANHEEAAKLGLAYRKFEELETPTAEPVGEPDAQ